MNENNTKRGRFIVFEGIDGSGKSTQISLLEKGLLSQGRRVYRTAEPTETAVGGLIRETLAGDTKRSACELASLFLADRIRHNVNPETGIKHYLESGVDVLCDRYYYSSFAYQGLDTDLDWVMELNLGCPEVLRPDLCVFLDVDAQRCKERVDKARLHLEIFEQSGEQLNRIRAKFFDVFERLKGRENIVVVDAVRTAEEISADILKLVLELQ